MKKHKFFNISTGGVSIITIMVVVSLAIFAALSISTALADMRMSQKYAQNVSSYYEADERIQNAFYEFAKLSEGGEWSLKLIEPFIDWDVSVDNNFSNDECVIEFNVPMNDTQKLLVKITAFRGDSFKVLDYRIINIFDNELEIEDKVEIWDGGEGQLTIDS